VTGSLALTQACWLGWSSSTTRCQAAARSASLSTGCPLSRSPVAGGGGDPGARVGRPCVPQVCPHLVNLAASLWKQLAETLTIGRLTPDHRRSDALSESTAGAADRRTDTDRPERGETRRAPNITLRGRPEQYAIHRLSGGTVTDPPEWVPGLFPHPWWPRGRFDDAKSRSVPFIGHPVSTGAACPRAAPVLSP